MRFQRNTSKLFKSDAAVFGLKKGGKNVSSEEYVLNLCNYFDSSRNVTNLTIGDLRNVLIGLNGTIEVAKEDDDVRTSEKDLFQYGEHVVSMV